MELKSGYKKTEIGIIPEDWGVDYIGNVCSITTGSKNTQDKIADGKYPFFVRSQTVERINTYSFDGEAVLTAGDGVGTGKIFHYINDKFDYHQRVYKMSHFNEEKLRGYFFYLFFSNYFYDRIMQMTAKSSVDSVRREMIAYMKISLPPLLEQKAIAEVLSDTDKLINSLEKKIAKKQLIKKGAMQKLLTPNEGWEDKLLGRDAILKARIGWQGLTTSEYKNSGEYYLITGTEFIDGYIDWDSCHFVDFERYKQDKNIQVKEHDVLVTKDGTIGKVALVKDLPKPATLNSGVFVIRPIENSFNPELLYFILLSDTFSKFLSQLSAGSTINHLYQKDFVAFRFKVPKSKERQAKIAQILSDMDDEIEELQKKLLKYKQLKQGLMQNLLTGKIRLV